MTEDRPREGQDYGDFASSLGRTIKVIRTDRGQSRRDLAREADISYSYVTEIENGRKPPSSPVLLRIAEALDVTPSELLAEAESRAEARLASYQLAAEYSGDSIQPPSARRRLSRHLAAPSAPAPSDVPAEAPVPPPAIRWSMSREHRPAPSRVWREDRRRATEDAIGELTTVVRRLAPEDVERLLDFARRLAR